MYVLAFQPYNLLKTVCKESIALLIFLKCVNSLSFRYVFIEYTSPLHASEAVKMANGYKLDKQHTLQVNIFSDFDK